VVATTIGVTVAEREKFFTEKREREGKVVQTPRKVVGVSGCDKGCVGRDGGEISGGRRRKQKMMKNKGERLIFCQLCTRFSSCSEYGICSYL